MDENPQTPADPIPAVAQPQQPSAMRKIFFNSAELRAGWRLLVFFFVLFLIIAGVNLAARALRPGPRPLQPTILKAGPLLVFESFQFLIVLLATFIMSRFERRRMSAYGLPLKGAFGRNFWVGATWGFAALTLVLLVMYGARDMSFGTTSLTPTDVLKYAFLWAGGFILVGFAEEYAFRGYVQFTLASGVGFWPAALVMSLLFGYVHSSNPGENPIGLVQVVLVGMFFCLTLWKTGNLWWAIGFHAGWDWGQSYFYGTPDSGLKAVGHLLNPSFRYGADRITGGSAGPEGSLLTVPLYVLLFVAFFLVYRNKPTYPSPAALTLPAPEAPAPQSVST